MSSSSLERMSRVSYVLIGVAIIAMLALLSWGIAQGNLMASMIAGAFLAMLIVVGGSVLLVPDNQRSQATERTLRMASSTFDHMRGGLTAEGCNAVCQLVLPETQAQAVAITDTTSVLAYVGELAPAYPPGSPNTGQTVEVLHSGRMETFTTRDTAAFDQADDAQNASEGVEGRQTRRDDTALLPNRTSGGSHAARHCARSGESTVGTALSLRA